MTSTGGHEIELKLRVPDGAALRAVAAAAGGKARPAVRQVNHFFDSASRVLREHAFGLRLRDEEGCFFLTAKGPSMKGASAVLSRRPEVEREILPAVARAILAGEASPLDVLERETTTKADLALCLSLRHLLRREALTYIGAFENLRTRVETTLPSEAGPLEVLLELDETRFPHGHVCFEVELELDESVAPDVAEAALRALLSRAGVEGFPSRGKASRFFALLEGRPL